jgi:hypothetical protein
MTFAFQSLDYLYTPSSDVARDAAWLTDVLGAQLVFAIEAMGTRVAMLELTDAPPRIVLADHLEGDRPILVYRVADLQAAEAELAARGWTDGKALEIPQGPVRSFASPGDQRIAIYELTRPYVIEGFAGRRDF